MRKNQKLGLTLAFCFALVIFSGTVLGALYTATQTWPPEPSGTSEASRFWRSAAGGVTITNKDSVSILGAVKTLTSAKFNLLSDNGEGGKGVPTELYFGGLYCGYADSLCDSLTVTYWWYDASGDSGRLAPCDTFKVDTTGLGAAATGKVAFLFRTSILEPEANAFIPNRIAVIVDPIDLGASGDSCFFDDCFLLGRWAK